MRDFPERGFREYSTSEYYDDRLGCWLSPESDYDFSVGPQDAEQLSTTTYLPIKGKSFKYADEEPLASFEHRGHQFSLLPDLRLFYTTQGAVTAVVPCEESVIRKRIYGCGAAYSTIAPRLLSWDKSLLPPPSIIRYWRDRLASACHGEAYLSIARKLIPDAPRAKYRWLGVVPKQEASGGGVDVDDLAPVFAKAVELGYEPLGATLHLHPSGMLGASGTDIRDYKATPALYIIAPRGIAACSVWVSAGGVVFNASDSHSIGEPRSHTAAEPLRAPKHCRLIGVDGRESNIEELIERPKPKKSHQTWYGGSKSLGKTSKADRIKYLPKSKGSVFSHGRYTRQDDESSSFLANLVDAIRYGTRPDELRIIVVRSPGVSDAVERVVTVETALRLEAQHPELVTVVELSGEHLLASIEDFIEDSEGAT